MITSLVQFSIINPLIGHLRSNDDVIRSIGTFLSITFDWNDIETWDMCENILLIKSIE